MGRPDLSTQVLPGRCDEGEDSSVKNGGFLPLFWAVLMKVGESAFHGL